jgi:hypothetical protein
MNTYVVIGAPGTGKTPYVRSLIEGNKCFVFDVQNEYGERTKYPGQTAIRLSNNVTHERSRYTGDSVLEYLALCKRRSNTVCIFEEATAFFEGKTGELTRKHLISCKHNGNVSAFLFHSINSVPPRIMEMTNYVVLFRTNDETHTVKKKFPRLLPYFETLQKEPKGSKFIIQMM